MQPIQSKQRTRIKICGITQENDARLAIDLGIDALGLVFYERSKRVVTIDQLSWLKQLPPFVQLTGLFVNPSEAFVKQVTQALPIDLLQFHGDESPAFCTQFSQRYVKAVPMQTLNVQHALAYMQKHSGASGFLLDNYGGSEIGGSGTTFDWSMIPESNVPLIIAGGLHADNIHHILATYQPYGVDVSSGVEKKPGVKSAEKMQQFINAVNSV